MRLVRILHRGKAHYAEERADGFHLLSGDDLMSLVPTGEIPAQEEVRLLAPVMPSKVVAVGLNYRDHAMEMGEEIPKEPRIFLKPSTSVIGPGEAIVLPSMSRRVDYEAELAVVIGRAARHVRPEEASSYILGYTCLNDVTARDLQKKDVQWTRSKSFDTFCPLGPAIETELDPRDLAIVARVNGVVRQSSRTANLIFSVPELLSFISQVMTLLPGDVIATGTPPGVGPLSPGDRVEIEIEGIGTLANPVVG
ncbi:MAG: fumarylacetoacetate hydrolase family protein [Firmicutes bacterium]|nr:fumarylacetoacetate hydrolase family protein [Bacillota bacterium]